jgi:LCP family protein required for cell wall assembly
LIISIGAGLIIFSPNLTVTDLLLAFLPKQEIPNSPYILVVGVDEADEVHRADTIMVFKVHNQTRKLNMISIPRDSYVYIPRYGYDKVNHAYAYGGIKRLKLTVEELLKINIHRYMQLSIKDMEAIIDIIGGVDLDVERRMYYVDHAGGINIDLKPGAQHLSAKEALDYIRFRKTADGDIGRIKRQQKLVQALVREVTKPYNLLKIPQVLITIKKRLDTDLSLREMVWLGGKVKKAYDNGQLFRATLPGRELIIEEISYLGIDKSQMAYIMDRAKDPTEVESKKPEQNKRAKLDFVATLALLNGNGVPGAATWATERLRARGFTVAYTANANYFNYEQTLLLTSKDKEKKARRLLKVLGLSRQRLQIGEIAEEVDAVLILGQDYQDVLGD